MNDTKSQVSLAVKALREYGANVMHSSGFKDKTWWIEDNGIWGLLKNHPQGFYLDDNEVIELAEQYTNFQTT